MRLAALRAPCDRGSSTDARPLPTVFDNERYQRLQLERQGASCSSEAFAAAAAAALPEAEHSACAALTQLSRVTHLIAPEFEEETAKRERKLRLDEKSPLLNGMEAAVNGQL